MAKGGNGKSCGIFGKTEIEYPVSFDLKVIMVSDISEEKRNEYLEGVFSSLQIPHSSWRKRKSGKGTYTSYTIHVTIMNQSILEDLYAAFRKNPDVKFAL